MKQAFAILLLLVMPVLPKNDPLRAPLAPGFGYINPNLYQYGTLLFAITIRPKPGKDWTVVNIQPELTPIGYRETILFCGDQTSRLNGHEFQKVVLIYSRAVPETAKIETPPKEITACHSLELVRVISKEESQ